MLSFSYIWPLALVVFSNTIYQICTKSVPGNIHPFAALTVTYSVAALSSLVFYFLMSKNADLLAEFRQLNWAPFLLGVVVVGLEFGFICAYQAGWPVSTASLVQFSFLTVILVFVGVLLYHETFSTTKLIGVIICMIGVFFINR